MMIMQYFLRSFRRRSPLKRSPVRLYTRCIFIFILFSILLSLIYSIFIVQSTSSESNLSDTIISLTTIPKRFDYELPLAIHSLLSQTELPKEIRIYLSPTAAMINNQNLTLTHLKIAIEHLDSSKRIARLFDRLVQVRFEEEDYGPATKFLPIIKEFHSDSQAIMICDDDQYYHPYTLATLNTYSNQFPNSMIGFRGWRIREDLIWGVPGLYEMARHIVESQYLSEVYRVGVLTANYAYLIRPSFFDTHIYLDFNHVPEDIRLVDDIWLNGHASTRNIARYVVPSCCSHISITRTHALEEYLTRNGMKRYVANGHALQWFRANWERDIWYRFYGENGPTYRSWWTVLYRKWISWIFYLKFILFFHSI